jgi:hypothetical protein
MSGAGARRESDGTWLTPQEAAQDLLLECRMVLPGIQTLFGFQLIAVFSDRFSELVSPMEQRMHLVAIALIVLSIGLVMGPAALHRQLEPRTVTERFLTISSRLLLWSMPPLALGICLDVHIVARVILTSPTVAVVIAGALLAVLLVLWFALPRSVALRRLAGGRRATS